MKVETRAADLTEEGVAPEDEISVDLHAALGDVWETTPLDSQEYKRALWRERRGQKPPNLHNGDDEERCGNCAYFGDGICDKYTYSVKADQLCDSWEAD